MKFNRKKLSHKEIDYAMKMDLDDVPYNFHIEKKVEYKSNKNLMKTLIQVISITILFSVIIICLKNLMYYEDIIQC